jgi:predicted dehydrogenase
MFDKHLRRTLPEDRMSKKRKNDSEGNALSCEQRNKVFKGEVEASSASRMPCTRSYWKVLLMKAVELTSKLIAQPSAYNAADCDDESPRRIKLAIIGMGSVARRAHLPVIQGGWDFHLGAVADPQESTHSTRHFSSLEALLQDSCLDAEIHAVSLCTPPQGRFQLAASAVSAGKHVLLEKPPLTSPTQLVHLEYLAKNHGVTLYTSWHACAMPAVLPAKNWLSGKQILGVRISWKEDVRWFHPGQKWIWEPAGFGVFDAGINALSILVRLIDLPISVESAVLSIPENVCTPIAASATLRTSQNAVISCEFDWNVGGKDQVWDIEVQTDCGILLIREGGKQLFIDGDDEGVHAKGWHEYETIYREFASLIRSGKSFVDCRPLNLVSDIFLVSERLRVPAFV